MNKTHLRLVALSIALLALLTTILGIRTLFVDSAIFPYITYRGEVVYLFGSGIYRHMGETMAHMGAAQDLVTLLIAIPMLILGAFIHDPENPRRMVFFTGVVAYFAVTYTLYLFMATYSQVFIVYVLLAGLSVNLLIYQLIKLYTLKDHGPINDSEATSGGIAVMAIASLMGLLWLSVIAPSIMESANTPDPLDHYTTLVVQGADLAFFLPWVFISGVQGFKKHKQGYLYMNVVLVFLSILMLALSAKIVAGMVLGTPGMPAIVILPLFMVVSIFHVIWYMKDSPNENHG